MSNWILIVIIIGLLIFATQCIDGPLCDPLSAIPWIKC
jgi:hypothetical protein